MTTEDKKIEKISEYGMTVSALHDFRYFNPANVYENEATPYNCPEDIKEILVERYGDKWKEAFWGADYDDLFPGVKALHEKRTGIKPKEEVCSILPTAAEARQQVIQNLSSKSQEQFETIAKQVKEAIANGQTRLFIDYEFLNPSVKAKLESLDYRVSQDGYFAPWVVYW